MPWLISLVIKLHAFQHRKNTFNILIDSPCNESKRAVSLVSRMSSVTSILRCYKTLAGIHLRPDAITQVIWLALFYKAVHGLCAIPTGNILVKADECNCSSQPTISSSDISLPIPPPTGIHSFPALYPSGTPFPQRPLCQLAPSEQSGPDFPPLHN